MEELQKVKDTPFFACSNRIHLNFDLSCFDVQPSILPTLLRLCPPFTADRIRRTSFHACEGDAQVNERRSKIQVITDILRMMQRENGKVKPTHILYKANLSHKLLKEHLNDLLQKGLIEVVIEKNRTYYQITQKGKEFVNEYRKIEKLAQAFGMPV